MERRKVLIFGDNALESAALKNEIQEVLDYGIEIFDLYPSSAHDVTEDIKGRVQGTQPDYVIFDTLAGQYAEAIKKSRQTSKKSAKEVACILYTNDAELVKKVEENKEKQGFRAFERDKGLGALIEYLAED